MKKILIIEDDSAIAEIEKDYLTLSGLDAAIITDGKKGLEEAQSGLYDLILLDLMLPGTDGFSICRRLRERLDIPILIVSARRDDIDKITRIVTVRGENKLLPNKEFQLLEFLMINADIVFSRETIYNRIWGMESFGNTSTVPVHINRIRDAIEKDPADPQHILTIWGVGYKFRP